MSNSDSLIRVHVGHQLPDGFPSPDVYFTPGYGRAACISEGGQWALLETFDGDWQVPLILRTLPDGTRDAISPYGYAGLYAAGSLSPMLVQQAWSQTLKTLADLGVISVLLRHSPLLPQAYNLPGLRAIIRGHPTIVLKPQDEESAFAAMGHNCRNKTRKALKNGYIGAVRVLEGHDLASGGDFRRLYGATMQRLGAASHYAFSDKYYKELSDGLGSNLLIAEVRNQQGTVVSSNLLMRHGQRLHSHLSCSNHDDAQVGSNNLLKWIGVQFAIDQGLSQFHLGGGLDGRDSLFRFKSSFGGRELEYRVSGVVIDEDVYQAQVENRAKECETTPEALLAAPYFPAYRGGTK